MKRIGLMLALLVMMALPISAQEAEPVDIGGFELVLPDGWSVADADYQSFYTMSDDMESVLIIHETGLEAALVSPDKVTELVPNIDDLDYQESLVQLATLAYDLDIAEEEFFTVDLGAVDGLRWFYEDTETVEDSVLQGDLYLIPLQEGGYLLADIYALESDFESDTETLESAMEDLFISAGAALFEDTPADGADSTDLPDGWTVAEDDYEPFYVMADDLEAVILLHDTGLEALMVSPEKVAELVPNADDLSYQEILVELATISYDMDMTEEEFFTVDLGAIDGLRWSYDDSESTEDEVIQGDLYIIPLTDGGYLYADIYAYQSYFEENVDALEEAMEDLFISKGAALMDSSDS